MSFWYNVATGQVETDETRGQGEDVMGPYASEEEARNALQKARENTEEWDAEDKAWNEKGAAPGWGAADDGDADA